MTLLELLLVMVLLISIYAAALWFGSTPNSNHQLDEGVGQLISLLRYSQAIAQQTGKPISVQFPHAATGDEAESSTTNATVMVVMETEPGIWVVVPELNDIVDSIDENIKVVQLSNEASTITFYPDGSFDGVAITIYSLANDDQRKATIKLNGINGTINQQ